MGRDYRRLLVFRLADELALRIYGATSSYPPDERFELRAQIRRAAVSVPTNIVEGSARRSLFEYLNFLNIATGSACEVRYILSLSQRLGYIPDETERELGKDYDRLMAQLQALSHSLEALGQNSHRHPDSAATPRTARSLKPEA